MPIDAVATGYDLEMLNSRSSLAKVLVCVAASLVVAACGGNAAPSGTAHPTSHPTVTVRPLGTPSEDGHTAPPLSKSIGVVAGYAEACAGVISGSSPNATVSLYSGSTVEAREVVGWDHE